MTGSSWRRALVGELLESVSAGVSVNSHGRPRAQGELGVLKTSAVTYGRFIPEENKAVLDIDIGRARVNPQRGCVLMSRMNTVALVGAAAFVDRDWPDLVLPDRIWQLRFNPARADGRWFHQLVSSPGLRSRISEMATGTSGSMKNLGKEKLLTLEIDLPPLPEQKKIAAILSSVDAAIESSQAVIEQLEVVKQAMMAELLTRGLPGRHTKFKRTEIGEVPDSWLAVALGEITEQVRRPVVVDKGAMYREIGVRSHGKGVFHKEPVRGDELGNKRVFWIEPGCLVFNIVFAWEGAVAETSDSEQGMIASHRFPMFRPVPGILSLQYLRLLFQTVRGIEILGSLSPGGAGRNKTLNQGELLRVNVPVPPIEEQELVASTITAVETRLRAEEVNLGAARGFKSAIMSDLLTGDLRVQPDEDAA